MAGSWRIEFYREPGGKVPVEDWLRQLRREAGPEAAGKVERAITLLEQDGFSLTTEYLHKVQGRPKGIIWELVATHRRNPYRVLFYNRAGNTLVLLVGFHKKTDAIPTAEIERAERRADEDRKRRR